MKNIRRDLERDLGGRYETKKLENFWKKNI